MLLFKCGIQTLGKGNVSLFIFFFSVVIGRSINDASKVQLFYFLIGTPNNT